MNKSLPILTRSQNLLTTVFLLISLSALAQTPTGTVTGIVSSIAGQPIDMASIRVKDSRQGAHTNDAGYFELHNIKPGNRQLQVSVVGYNRLDTVVAVTAGSVIKLRLILTASSSGLNEVVVSSTRSKAIKNVSTSLRLNTPLLETPQNITVTSSQTIKSIGALSLADILRTSSGIIAGGDKQDISFNVRGTQVYSSILRNGVGSGYWYNQEADASMIERVEFIKGPAGFMISNTEPGGLVNIVTKQPSHERIANVSFGAGSWNLMRTNVDLGGELSKDGKLMYRLNAGLQRQNDYYQFGKFRKYFAAFALKYEIDSCTSVTAEYNRMEANQLSDGQNIPTVNGKFFVIPSKTGLIDPNVPGTHSGDNYYRFQISHKLNDKWRVNAQAAAVRGPWGGYMMYTQGMSPKYDSVYRYMAYTNWQNNLHTFQAFLDGTFNTGKHAEHKVLIGVDYGNTDVVSRGGNTYGETNRFALRLDSPTYYIPVDTLKNFNNKQFESKWGSRYQALYLQDNIKLYNKLVITLAARYTNSVSWANYSNPVEQTDNKLVPRFGLTWLFTPNISAYALYDGAFIAQNGRSFSGQVFKPLTGNNKEIGIKGQFFDGLNAGISAYNITKNNALTADPIHPSYQVQTGQLVSKGIEFDVNGNILPNLNMFANYAYTDAKITRDNNLALVNTRLSGSVQTTFNVFGRYTFGNELMKGFSIGGGMQYMGKVSAGVYTDYSTDPATTTFSGYFPSRTTFEASTGYTYKKMYVNLNVYNIFNKRYIISGYQTTNTDWSYQPGQPTSFRLSLGFNL